MSFTSSRRTTDGLPDLSYQPRAARNVGSRVLTVVAALFSGIAVLPLVLVLGYVLIKGGSTLGLNLLTELPLSLIHI